MKVKNVKKYVVICIVAILLVSVASLMNSKVYATSTTYITLTDSKITVNGETLSSDSSSSIYLSSKMDNGGTSDDAIDANIAIDNIINITSSGTYEFSGTLSNGQISVNSNNIDGEVVIILNNVDITCKDAPAIFVYNKSTESDNCTVTIKLADGSTNVISGGKIKQSVEGWTDQSELLYYVDKGYDDERNYYERYKYDGAISSDISLTFEGNGTLTVNSLKKEGIESKGNITINSGNYIINSLDDGINACTDNKSVITINGGTVLVNVTSEAEEGDGIDSNGSIYINGGYVYAFACETSQDNGLDADTGIHINGGYVVATGNMADTVNSSSNQNYLQLRFTNKVASGDLITITGNSGNAQVAFKSDRSYSILTISTPNLSTDNISVYEGGTIQGTENNGLYTEISSYTKGTEKAYSTLQNQGMPGGNFGEMRQFEQSNQNSINTNNQIYIYTIIVAGVILVILILFAVILNKK